MKPIALSDRGDLGSYTSPLRVTLPSSGNHELAPSKLKATVAGSDSIYISWGTAGPGRHYEVRSTTNPSAPVSQWRATELDTHGGVVTDLPRNARSTFMVRVTDRLGNPESAFSDPIAATTSSAVSPRINLVSYNIHKAKRGPSWSSRRDEVASTILSQNPDVVALQEATPVSTSGVRQYDDILKRLGSTYTLNTRAASNGSKLAYNTARLKLEKAGTKKLPTVGPQPRYATWAVFEDRLSGRDFFVLNTHLEPGSQTSTKMNNSRIRQAREIVKITKAEAGNLPVLVVGDMNASRAARPSNGQYKVFTEEFKLTDPTANYRGDWKTGRLATAEHGIDWNYNSANKYERYARQTSYPVGTHIDYAYHNGGVRVGTYRLMLKLDTAGKFIGTIPSDHNPVSVNFNLK